VAEPRRFTLDEARRTLPLVSRIVADIVAAYPAFQARVDELQRLTAEGVPEARVAEIRRELDEEAARINAFVAELQQIGGVFKGFEQGLVDFHAELDGRTICLCWKHGEEQITHWHELDAGFAGRQPIDAELAAALGDPAE
jgi:hypothetical protein